MSIPARVLATQHLSAPCRYFQPGQSQPARVTPASPALDVMTDLRQVTALTTTLNARADDALQQMIQGGVKLLLVADEGRRVLGLLTATDLAGEKPVRVAQQLGVKRGDLLVRDIMTGWDRLELIAMEDIERATVADLVATLKQTGRQHALALDQCEGQPAIRGLFSATQIGRQLGAAVVTAGKASSFADLGKAIGA
jgi:CBS-domain-containing membrane protein